MIKQFSCRFCKTTDVVKSYSANDIRDNQWYICECNSCKAIFLSPDPTVEELKLAYDSHYYGEEESKFGFSVERFIDFYRYKRAKKTSSQIPQKARVLDLGCGNGRFLKHLSSLGDFELFGIELEGVSAERAAKIKEINLKIGPLKENAFSPEYFDAVILFHVFEHLDKPEETIKIINTILKKDGLLVISLPNIAGWQSKIFKGKWYHLDPPRHLIFFNPDDLVKIINSMGFRLINKKWHSFEQNPYGWVQSCLNCFCKRREVLYERLKGNKNYAPEYGSFNIFLQKLFFLFSFPFFIIVDFTESILRKSATVQLTFRKNK